MLECSSQPDPLSKTDEGQIHEVVQLQNKHIDCLDYTLQQNLSQEQTSQTNLQELGSMIYSIEQKLSVLLPATKSPSPPHHP